jgi:hypothetical protein
MTQRFAWSIILGISLLAFAAPNAADASVIFSNFGAALSYDTTSGNPVGNAFDGNTWAEGNSFMPSAAGIFQSLRIALSCAFVCPDAVTVSLNRDAGDQPGAVLESFSIAGGSLGPIGTNNSPLLLNSVLLPQFIPGTQYWVTVSAPLTDSVAWNLNSTGDASDQAISSDGGATWFSPSGNTPGALEVNAGATGSVPEPSTWALLAGAGLLLSLMRRVR